ncbi:MAG: 4'-phosphopantetheinyl transferase family protein [Lysobacter sp.]
MGAGAVLVEQVDWLPWLDDARGLLDARELACVERRYRPGDRVTLILAYALHRLLLSVLLDIAPADVPIGRDAKGCPRLEGHPIWTSLSHAEGHLAFAFSRAGPVGIDIEPSSRATELPEIADRVCTPVEANVMRRLEGSARAKSLLELWVRKEALLKAAGIGLERAMETFDAPAAVLLKLEGLQGVRARMLASGPDCVAAIASVEHPGVEGRGPDIQWLRSTRM